MIENRFISKKDGLYIIHRNINGTEYVFGEHINLEDAIEEHDLLETLDWPLFSAIKAKLVFDDDINSDINSSNVDEKDEKDFYDSHLGEINEDHVKVSFKIGSAYKHSFLVLTRSETEDIIPILPYEKECDVIFDGIKAKIKLNVLLRLTLTKGNDELRKHLEELSLINPNRRSEIAILLNKENKNPISNNNAHLIKELDEANKKISELNRIIEELININKKYEEILLERTNV